MVRPHFDARPDRHRPAGLFRPPVQTRPLSLTIDWPAWLRNIERYRRDRPTPLHRPVLTNGFVFRATLQTFRLENIAVADSELADATSARHGSRALGSRQRQRLRNHFAIMRASDRAIRRHRRLEVEHVLRWYTSISSGLSTHPLDTAGLTRVTHVVGQINSPQSRLQPAMIEIAHLHCDLHCDPLFPAFNGILVRLLLGAHLGQCGLPPVIFDPEQDRSRFTKQSVLLPRLLQAVEESYEMLLDH